MIHKPVTVVNVLEVPPREVAHFLNTHVLNNKIPLYTPNHQVSVQADLVPRLGKYANDKAYVTELYNIIISAYFEQKGSKRRKDGQFDEDAYTDLEAKKEILYRTAQALDRMYEAASRLMTGIGAPDSRMGRHL
jgi:hypothetical protein